MKKVTIVDNGDGCFLCKNCLKEWIPAILAHKKNYKVKKRWGADKELILRFANEGTIFGHRALGGDGIYSISATAVQAGIISYVDVDFFETTLKVNAEFAYKLLLFIASEL